MLKQRARQIKYHKEKCQQNNNNQNLTKCEKEIRKIEKTKYKVSGTKRQNISRVDLSRL